LISLILLPISLFFFFQRSLQAQLDTGAILGTVQDTSGAVIPKAKVTLTNEGTAFSVTTATDSSGNYIFTPVRIGTYSVQAEFQGFQVVKQPHVVVNVQQQVVVNLTLSPGQVTQTIEVTGAPPLLQTQSATVGQVVGTHQVNDLPLNGRNYTFLAQLSAGVSQSQQDGRGLEASGSFTANGTRAWQSDYLLDAIDNNSDLLDYLNGAAYCYRPAVDAIQEFKVQTSNYSAEYGRAAGAVLNATIKSGTNHIHGNVWEFVRNNDFDAADFFENAAGLKKGEYRLNQFGGTLGGPIVIPHVYNGKDKTFFFVDYEGTRIRQASTYTTTVPTATERNSGYTDLQDLITYQSGTRTDDLGRTFPLGAVFDPATTRTVTAGQADPVTGLTATSSGFVRDPFYQGSLTGVTNFTTSTAIPLLNNLPAGRLDPNAIKLLNLYPAPIASGIFNNYSTNPIISHTTDQFDVRVDHNFSSRDQIFGRVSWANAPGFVPPPFPGIADGGAFNGGNVTNSITNDMLSETHAFSSTLINEARVGFNRIGTSTESTEVTKITNIPGQFGIQGIPQIPLNGGLPTLDFSGLAQLGGAAWMPSVEYDSTFQLTDNLTKVYGSHNFKGGFEWQHVKFAAIQPGWPRGGFDFDGTYTEVPNTGGGNTGLAQALLIPTASTVPNGFDNVGGADNVYATYTAMPDMTRDYYGIYFQDDWKVSRKLTLNLGLRWDWYGEYAGHFGAQANFSPGAPNNGAEYLIPQKRCSSPRSASFNQLTQQDGIAVVCAGNPALVDTQNTNFGPRIGFAYQVTPKLVARGGYGMFYDGFEVEGLGYTLGFNYPFEFTFNYVDPDAAHPVTYPSGGIATLETGLSSIALSDPAQVNAAGLSLSGIQKNFQTPYTQAYNFNLQYQLTPNQTFQLGYVGSASRHVMVMPYANLPNLILPLGLNPQNYVPFPDFARGPSYMTTEGNSGYNSLQATFERRFSGGLNILGNYTWSKVRTDAKDMFEAGNNGGYRAPYLPGFGIQGDYGLSDFDTRQIAHFSGSYQLPFGKGKPFLHDSSGFVNQVAGGWNTNWILTLEDGQPFSIPCAVSTTADFGCNPLLVAGQNLIGGKHNVNQWVNPAAFATPPAATTVGQSDLAPLGGAVAQVAGPGLHRLDFSLFKEFQTSESTHLEFRFEIFNLTNTPFFGIPGFAGTTLPAAPGALDYTNTVNFGKITSTRDAPNDPRQLQFALKFYF
jgi:hypothetical protein